jgi:hypothetical protein
MRWVFPLVLCCALAPAVAADHVPATDEELSAVFLCPESLLDDKARETAVEAFVEWVVDHHPDWTLEQLAGFRLRLLASHHCEATLAAIRAEASAAR